MFYIDFAPIYLHRRVIRQVLLLLAVTSICPALGLAQGRNTTSNDVSSARTISPVTKQFAEALEVLAERWKITFVVEGEPATMRLAGTPRSLSQAVTPQADVDQADVDQVAESFDYAAVRNGNIFILTKLYTDLNEVPDVTRSECLLAINSASRLLDPYNPRFPPPDFTGDPRAKGIVRLLSAEQLQMMSQGGLPVSSLSELQRTEVWRDALTFYVKAQAQLIDDTSGFLTSLNRQDPLFHWQDLTDIYPSLSGVKAFGYNVILESTHSNQFIPLSHQNRIVVDKNGGTLVYSDHKHNGIPVEDVDPTDPGLAGGAATVTNISPVAIPLAHAMDILNASSHLHYRVDEALAQKRVTLVGPNHSHPSDIMNALAAVYGLRVVQKDNGVMWLTRRAEHSVRNIDEVGRAVYDVVPGPIVRALHARIEAAKLHRQHPNRSLQRPISLVDYRTAARELVQTTTRRLRLLVEPQIAQSKNKQLALSQLGEPERKLFAVILTIRAFAEACWLGNQSTPTYLTDFDHVVLTGGQYRASTGELRFALYLSYKDPQTGDMRHGPGVDSLIVN